MSTQYYHLGSWLGLEQLEQLLINNTYVVLSAEAKEKIVNCRSYLDSKLEVNSLPIYGINTGFGSLCNTFIPESDLKQLQINLLRSHACGLGDPVPTEVVKIMLLLKALGLSKGHSGVKLETVERLLDFYNNDVIPVVYNQGSLGASGDLAPLAHMCLPLIGEGEVWENGTKVPAQDVLNRLGWKPLSLGAKEGLALINGTQFMSGYGAYILIKSKKLKNWADFISSISLDAFDGRVDAFHPLIHAIRPHQGQIQTAAKVLNYLEGSSISIQPKKQVQDPYSFRCIPQIHGASADAIQQVCEVFETEINAVSDNPNIFPEEDLILSGGNFHGQPLAIHLDFLSIALAELGSVSERRVYLLISGQRELPPFLTPSPGLNSGFMIAQYTMAAIVSENKQLATPASVDSIVSSNGQEDHVSMGANAAVQAYKIATNLESLLAIELLTASQAMYFRAPLKSSKRIEHMLQSYRNLLPFVADDCEMAPLFQKSIQFIRHNNVRSI